MLGQAISDPLLTESNIEEIHGIGLLEIDTTMEKEKVTSQAEAEIIADTGLFDGILNSQVQGYEIHMGSTKITGDSKVFLSLTNISGRETDVVGVVNYDERVLGTYLHGIFDNVDFTLHIINKLREAKGAEKIYSTEDYKSLKDKEYDKLAKVLRNSLDMKQIYRILNNEG